MAAVAGDPGALAALRVAYAAFYDEASAGGFAGPEPGEWSAAEVVAHVTVNDGLLAAVCDQLADDHGAAALLDNLHSNDRHVLRARIDATGGDLAVLVAQARAASEDLCRRLESLPDEALGAAVHARLVDGGTLRVDREFAWAELMLRIQPAGHLPGHTEQLRRLRPT